MRKTYYYDADVIEMLDDGPPIVERLLRARQMLGDSLGSADMDDVPWQTMCRLIAIEMVLQACVDEIMAVGGHLPKRLGEDDRGMIEAPR